MKIYDYVDSTNYIEIQPETSIGKSLHFYNRGGVFISQYGVKVLRDELTNWLEKQDHYKTNKIVGTII